MVAERLGQAWRAWRSVPGVLHRVHELAVELVGRVPELKLAMRENLRGLTELAGAVESVRLDLERARLVEAQPVTVSLLVRMARGTEPVWVHREWPPVIDLATGRVDAPEPVRVERPRFETRIGAKTIFLEPAARQRVEFVFPEMVAAESLVWVSGPAVVERVIVGNQICDALSTVSAGVAAIVPMVIEIGQVLTVDVIGIRRPPVGRGRASSLIIDQGVGPRSSGYG